MKEFVTWAITVWPILAALGGVAILISGWVIKHDFGSGKGKKAVIGKTVSELELSNPIAVPRHPETVMHDDRDPWHVEVDLWRVTVTNTQQHSQASNVCVQITKSVPPISMLPITLHERDDKTQPYKKSWTLRYGETLVFDVISFQTLAIDRDSGRPVGLLYLYRSDSGDSIIPFKIPERETARAMQRKGMTFTIFVYADLPTKGITRRYRAFIDEQKHFVLETYGKTSSR